MINKAIAKLTEEAKNDKMLILLEEHLTNLCTTDAIAEKILNKDKSLGKFFEELKNYAKSIAKGNSVAISDEEVYQRLRDYYGITDEEPAAEEEQTEEILDVLDFM